MQQVSAKVNPSRHKTMECMHHSLSGEWFYDVTMHYYKLLVM